jgi:hypothetical protein
MELPPSFKISPPITTLSIPIEVGVFVIMVGKQSNVCVGSWELLTLTPRK